MVSFEVYNVTLWNIVMSINRIENDSCSLQLIRAYEESTFWSGDYGRNKSEFLDASVNMMISHSIPLVLMDFSFSVSEDVMYWQTSQIGLNTPLLVRFDL